MKAPLTRCYSLRITDTQPSRRVRWQGASVSDTPPRGLPGRSFFSSWHHRDAGTGSGCCCAGRRLNRWQLHRWVSLSHAGSQRRGTSFCQCTWLARKRKLSLKITTYPVTLRVIFLVVMGSVPSPLQPGFTPWKRFLISVKLLLYIHSSFQ